jgi:DNA repair exonuclease SbcCD ATPase subunit
MTESIRYQQLLKGIDKVMQESRSKVDVAEAVNTGYGNDASLFDQDMLPKVFEGMLDRISDQVQQDMKEYLETHKVEQDLLQVEALLQKFEEVRKAEEDLNARDRESAKAALKEAQLPEGVKPADVVQYRAYEILQKEKKRLSEVIGELEEETKELQKLSQEAEKKIHENMQQVEEVSSELDRNADACSTLT